MMIESRSLIARTQPPALPCLSMVCKKNWTSGETECISGDKKSKNFNQNRLRREKAVAEDDIGNESDDNVDEEAIDNDVDYRDNHVKRVVRKPASESGNT
jgi:hypothetical protein